MGTWKRVDCFIFMTRVQFQYPEPDQLSNSKQVWKFALTYAIKSYPWIKGSFNTVNIFRICPLWAIHRKYDERGEKHYNKRPACNQGRRARVLLSQWSKSSRLHPSHKVVLLSMTVWGMLSHSLVPKPHPEGHEVRLRTSECGIPIGPNSSC